MAEIYIGKGDKWFDLKGKEAWFCDICSKQVQEFQIHREIQSESTVLICEKCRGKNHA